MTLGSVAVALFDPSTFTFQRKVPPFLNFLKASPTQGSCAQQPFDGVSHHNKQLKIDYYKSIFLQAFWPVRHYQWLLPTLNVLLSLLSGIQPLDTHISINFQRRRV